MKTKITILLMIFSIQFLKAQITLEHSYGSANSQNYLGLINLSIPEIA